MTYSARPIEALQANSLPLGMRVSRGNAWSRYLALWLKYFSNLHRARARQCDQLWGFEQHNLLTCTLPSTVRPSSKLYNTNTTINDVRQHTYTRLIVHTCSARSMGVFSDQNLLNMIGFCANALSNLSLAHWMQCSICAGNDFSVQNGTSSSTGSRWNRNIMTSSDFPFLSDYAGSLPD